jgi:hypothetical protein
MEQKSDPPVFGTAFLVWLAVLGGSAVGTQLASGWAPVVIALAALTATIAFGSRLRGQGPTNFVLASVAGGTIVGAVALVAFVTYAARHPAPSSPTDGSVGLVLVPSMIAVAAALAVGVTLARFRRI